MFSSLLLWNVQLKYSRLHVFTGQGRALDAALFTPCHSWNMHPLQRTFEKKGVITYTSE